MKIRRYYKPEACASKDKERFNLVDPFYDVAGAVVVSTDGHRLVAVPVEVEPGESSGYVSRELLKVARKVVKQGDAEIRDKAEVVPFEIEWPCDQGRTFPDWRQAVPAWDERSPGTLTIGLNAKLLKGIADALGSEGIVAITVMVGEVDKAPIRVRALGGDPGEIGILMPCRVGEAPRRVIDLPPTESETRAAEKAEVERLADEILKKDGHPEMTRKSLTGEAVAHTGKKRG